MYVTLYCIYYVYINIFFFFNIYCNKEKRHLGDAQQARASPIRSKYYSLRCTVLYCTVLYILYCTALHSTGLN